MISQRLQQADALRRAGDPCDAHDAHSARDVKSPANLNVLCLLVALGVLLLSGCGKSTNRFGTEQLVLSDAVDRAVRSIDFSPLAGRKSYLDTSYIKYKPTSFVNSDYITSSLRNQLLAAGCLLVEEREEAEIVIEPRVGSLGSDSHEVIYGIPSNNMISQAAALVPAAPLLPTIPEISLAKKDDQMGAAKIAVFAYRSDTGRPVWQSGMSVARSTSRDSWFLGIGPFQNGTIYKRPRFAGNRLSLPLIGTRDGFVVQQTVSLDEQFLFADEPPLTPAEAVRISSVPPTEDAATK